MAEQFGDFDRSLYKKEGGGFEQTAKDSAKQTIGSLLEQLESTSMIANEASFLSKGNNYQGGKKQQQQQ